MIVTLSWFTQRHLTVSSTVEPIEWLPCMVRSAYLRQGPLPRCSSMIKASDTDNYILTQVCVRQKDNCPTGRDLLQAFETLLHNSSLVLHASGGGVSRSKATTTSPHTRDTPGASKDFLHIGTPLSLHPVFRLVPFPDFLLLPF